MEVNTTTVFVELGKYNRGDVFSLGPLQCTFKYEEVSFWFRMEVTISRAVVVIDSRDTVRNFKSIVVSDVDGQTYSVSGVRYVVDNGKKFIETRVCLERSPSRYVTIEPFIEGA